MVFSSGNKAIWFQLRQLKFFNRPTEFAEIEDAAAAGVLADVLNVSTANKRRAPVAPEGDNVGRAATAAFSPLQLNLVKRKRAAGFFDRFTFQAIGFQEVIAWWNGGVGSRACGFRSVLFGLG